MKSYKMLAGALLFATANTAGAQGLDQTATGERPYFSSAASYMNIDLKKAKRNTIASLNHENDGVVESALAHATHMRLMMPQEDFKDSEMALGLLAGNGRTPGIRYKAYVASLVFASPEMFAREINSEYAHDDQFFGAIASRLQQTLLGHSTR